MKILILAENWPPRIGGIERYLTNIAEELAKNHSVIVIAPRVHEQVDDSKKAFRVIRKRFFSFFIRPKWLPLFIYVYKLIQREQIDVVICGKGLFEGLVGHYLKKYLRVPYVVCTYAMEIETWSSQRGNRRALIRSLSNADVVTYINDDIEKALENLGVQKESLLKLQPGIQETFIQPNPSPAHTTYGLKSRYMISVSRLVPRKGLNDLIEAFAKLDGTKYSDVQLVIVGDGPEKAALQRLAVQLFLNLDTSDHPDNKVRFLDSVPDKDLPSLLSNAEFFALTPKRIGNDVEGFGIVYLEAAAAGIPALGTMSGGVKEAVLHEKTGLLVTEGDIQEIATAIEKLLSDETLRKKFGEASRTRALNEFRWNAQVYKLENRLKAIVPRE